MDQARPPDGSKSMVVVILKVKQDQGSPDISDPAGSDGFHSVAMGLN